MKKSKGGVIFVVAFAVAVLALRGNVAYAQEVHDHFKSYFVTGHLLPTPIDVTLSDQFGTVQGTVEYITLFSPPTEKLLPGGGVSPIIHPENHLTWYEFVGPPGAQQQTLLVTNQFGDGQEWVVKDPKFLLLPAWKLYVNGLPTGLDHPSGLDHYLCYEAISGPPVGLDGVILTDQFHQELVTVGDPKLLCNPADKVVPDDGMPIYDNANHLACYDIIPQLPPPPFEVWANDQFGDSMFMVLENRYLCVPSLKSTTSSTTTTTTSTTTTTLPPSVLDHYKCYQAKPLKKVCQLDPGTTCKLDTECTMGGICLQKFPKGISVALTDQFEEVTVEVKKPKNICPPVEKLPQGPTIQDPNLHYKEYQIKGGAKLEQRVLGTDQFGNHVLELGKPKFLLVPTMKGFGPVAPPTDGEHDHYLCRQAKHKKKICTGDLTTKCKTNQACIDAGAGATCDLGFEKRPQNLRDQFGDQNVEMKKIKYFCTPAVKTPPGDPIVNNVDHLVGYQIKGPDFAITVHTNNQFGPEVVTTKKPRTLYVPAVKTLPPVE